MRTRRAGLTGGVGRDFYLCSTKPGPAGSPPLPTEVRAIDGLVGAIKLLVVAPEGVAVDPFGFGELNVSLQPFGGVFAHGGLQEGRQELRHGFEFPLSVQADLFRDAGQHRPGNTETLSTGRGASTILLGQSPASAGRPAEPERREADVLDSPPTSPASELS